MDTASDISEQAVRVAALAVAAVSQCPTDSEPLLAAVDYLAVAGLGFASQQPDGAWDDSPTSPAPPLLECLEEIGRLTLDWGSDVCDTHPDWNGFYRSLLFALGEVRRRDAA
jgi:hypothetical protein